MEARRVPIQQRAEEIRSRMHRLMAETSRMESQPDAARLEAVLTGTAEPDDQLLRERAERAQLVNAELEQLGDDVELLEQEALRNERASERLAREVAAAEVDCLRVLEAQYLERYHAEIGRLIVDVLLPMRAIAGGLADRGEDSPAGRLLGTLQITAKPSAQSRLSSTTLWVSRGYLMQPNLPAPLAEAVQEPLPAVAERLIEGLREDAEGPTSTPQDEVQEQ